MATTATDDAPVRRRRIVPLVVAGCLVPALAGALCWYLVYAATYAPLTAGSSVGPASAADANALVPTTGSPARIKQPGMQFRVMIGIVNDGPVGVTIDGVILDDVQVHAQWSEYHSSPGGNVMGDDRPFRDFDAALPAHGRIRLIVTLRQPDCATEPLQAGQGFDAVTLTWHAMGRSHTTTIHPGLGIEPYLQYCPPPAK